MSQKRVVVFIFILFFSFENCFSDLPVGYEGFTDWQGWARLRRGVSSRLASSYDRSDGNRDYSYYEFPEGPLVEPQEVTVKTIDGPGVITRFWMPHCMARRQFTVKMFFDGQQSPTIDTDSTQIMEGNYDYFGWPFVETCAGGQVCYEPIFFEDSLVIKSYNKDVDATWYNRHYYQYTYSLYPEGTDINSYTPGLNTEQSQLRNDASAILSDPGYHPAGESETAIDVNTVSKVIDPNEELIMADITGPGIIRRLNVKMPSATDAELKGVNLKVFYDGLADPAIDVPVALFFGAGRQRAAYKSLVMGTDSVSDEGFYCFLPMPFRESVKVALYNTLDSAVNIDFTRVEYEPCQVSDDLCYLHAQVNTTERQSSSQIYHTLVSDQGCGHYIGSMLYCVQDVNSFRFLEGDDHITVDGEVVQYGTGLEDAYNGGAYYNWVAVQEDEPEGGYPQSATRPLNGILYIQKEPFGRADQYRWRIPDCIPYFDSINAKVEISHAYTSYNPVWTSVGFFYKYHCLRADLNDDCVVDFKDFSKFAEKWLY